jgi:branched-chain amino acid transport system ATP-binding protein
VNALLEVEDLRGGYGQIEVLRGITVRVLEAEAVGLLGPNGHGKTTLMRTISGLRRPRAGAIRFAGASIVKASPRTIVDRGLVHVPQGNRLFPDCTVHENLLLGAYAKRARRRRDERLELVYGLFPRLAERRRQLCGTLSGGERQMVAIAVGLMADPVLLMLDEPTLGLAPRIRDEVRSMIEEIRRMGVALVIADGDLEFLHALTDRRYVVELGRVAMEQHGTDDVSDDEVVAMYFSGSAPHG